MNLRSFKLLLCILSFTVIPFFADAQSIYGEVSVSKGHLYDFYAVPFHDSVLFSYAEATNKGTSIVTRWMREDGKSTNLSLNVKVAAIAKYEDGVYYYSFAEDNKSIRMKAVVEDLSSGSVTQAPTSLLLPEGILLGMCQDEDLLLFIYNKDQNRITSLAVRGLEIVKERHYELPVILSKYIRRPSDVEFFNGSRAPFDGFKGYSKVKLFRYDDLYIVIDSRSSEKKGTQVIVLPSDKDEAELHFFPTETGDDFVSYLVDRKLFRSIISPKKFLLTVNDLDSQELLATTELLKGQEEFEGYTRTAKYRTIGKESLKRIMSVAGMGDPSLTILKESGKYIILWGHVINDNGMMAPAGLNPLAGMITMVVGTAILQMSEGPGISRHFYYELDEKDLSFKRSDTATYVRKKLDEYEIARQAEGVKVKYKGYIPYKNGIIGIYYEPKRKTVTLVNFQ